MLFDPSRIDSDVDASAGAIWQPPRVAVARRRPATGFLTLPDVSSDVPARAALQWRAGAELNELALAQFQHGPLRAADVRNPTSVADAFGQAFFAWIRRQMPRQYKRLLFQPLLFDLNAAHDIIQYQYYSEELSTTSPLLLSFEMPEEQIFEMASAIERFRAVHPLLMHTALSLVDWASWRTLFIRTPGWFFESFARWHWECDESVTDEQAREIIEGYRGEFDEDCKRYLPSVVKPAVYPDELREPARIPGRRRRARSLSEHELLTLRRECTGTARRVCTEVIALGRLLRRGRPRQLLGCIYDARPAYSACTIVAEANDRISEMLDDHFESESQGGEATTYNGFAPLASTAVEIRQQYADWTVAFQVLYHLDRLLSLITTG